jgi:hypothetical protein
MVIGLAAITLLFMSLATGFAPPFGTAFRWLWDHFMVFHAFSESLKFLHIAAFGISIFLGVSTAALGTLMSRWANGKSLKMLRRAFTCAVLILILVNSFPLVSGDLSGIMKPIQPPEYYYEAARWLDAQGHDFRVMEIPTSPVASYSWSPSYAFSNTASARIFPAEVWFESQEVGNDLRLGRLVERTVLNNRTQNAGKMLAALNVRYIYIADETSIESRPSIISALTRQEDVEFRGAFGEISFFENKAWTNIVLYGTTAYVMIPRAGQGAFYRRLCELSTFHPERLVVLSAGDASVDARISREAFNVGQHASVRWSAAPIRLTRIASGELGYITTGSWDWSSADLVSFLFMTSQPGSYVLSLSDAYGNTYEWIFETQRAGVWEQIIISVDEPDAWVPEPQKMGVLRLGQLRNLSIHRADSAQSYFGANEIHTGTMALTDVDVSGSSVDLSWGQVGLSDYKIEVSTDRPFVLVLSKPLDANWILGFGDNYEQANIPHFRANIYANGWYVDRTGTFTLLLHYERMNYVTWGIVASLAALPLAILWMFPGNKAKKNLLKKS